MKDYILDLDKPRKLRYGFKALRLLRQKFGDRSLENLMDMPTDEMPVFAWAGLKWNDNALTVERTEEMLDAAIPENHTIVGATTIILTALAAHMGVESKKVQADALKKIQEKIAEEKKAEKKPAPTEKIPTSKTRKKKP